MLNNNDLFTAAKIVNLLSKKSTYEIVCVLKMDLFCILILLPMQLMMYIGNDLIESVPLEVERISRPGYLGSFKRWMKDKHGELILQFQEPPQFLVVDPVPKPSN
jgi:hypothetical protein